LVVTLGVPKVRVRDLTKEYYINAGGSTQVVNALNGVSFDINVGEFVALTGRSGCGKTTSLRIVLGLEEQTSGTVEIDGREVYGCGYDRGMVFQHAELLPWRTAIENVEFGLELKGVGRTERRGIASKMLELVGLKNSADRRPYQLSGGMKQRVGLARALSADPEVLLMDEPFGALDAQIREEMQTELLLLHEKTKKTIMFVTHDIDEAVLLADRVVIFTPLGKIHEIVEINLPRPRTDAIALRGSEEFQNKRYQIWRMLKLTDEKPAKPVM
jgi:ABC-type nitrate/sulfonate/bicarbonate transport system ATPase subunit